MGDACVDAGVDPDGFSGPTNPISTFYVCVSDPNAHEVIIYGNPDNTVSPSDVNISGAFFIPGPDAACASTAAGSGVIGHTGGQPPAAMAAAAAANPATGAGSAADGRDTDTWLYHGKAGEAVAVRLEVDPDVGGFGEAARLRVETTGGQALANRAGPLPLEARLTLPSTGTIRLVALGPPRALAAATSAGGGGGGGATPFHGGYRLLVTDPAGGGTGGQLEPLHDVEK
jgi:hypothetical protein